MKGKIMNHLEFAQSESQALFCTDWESFLARCTKLCKEFLHEDFEGKPSFDGDQDVCGYSLDWLYQEYEDAASPEDILQYFAG